MLESHASAPFIQVSEDFSLAWDPIPPPSVAEPSLAATSAHSDHIHQRAGGRDVNRSLRLRLFRREGCHPLPIPLDARGHQRSIVSQTEAARNREAATSEQRQHDPSDPERAIAASMAALAVSRVISRSCSSMSAALHGAEDGQDARRCDASIASLELDWDKRQLVLEMVVDLTEVVPIGERWLCLI